jgi:hypothetical protein
VTTNVCEPFATVAQHESMAFECLLAFLSTYSCNVAEFRGFIPFAKIVNQARATKGRVLEAGFSGVLGFEDGLALMRRDMLARYEICVKGFVCLAKDMAELSRS